MKTFSSEEPMKFPLLDCGNEALVVVIAQQLLFLANVLIKGDIIWTVKETYWFHSIVQMLDSLRGRLEYQTDSDSWSPEAIVMRAMTFIFSVFWEDMFVGLSTWMRPTGEWG